MLNKKKLIVIGIDGGNFEVINSLFKKGLLKNLKKFKHSAVLTSTIPPGTAVAWASFSTGNYPGKTRIYDFTIVNEDSWKISFINRKKLRGKTMWDYLNENKIKSCFMNIPLTYPPDKIKGVIISGIDAPSTLNEYTSPPEIKNELKKFNYEIEVSGINKKEDIVKKAEIVLNKRINAAKFLLKKNFDFFTVLFRESDVAQHFAWGKKGVEKIYIKIDNFIGETVKFAEQNKYDLLIISDHGEEKVDKAFNINAWLEKEGYLETNIKKSSILSSFGITRERIFKILKKLRIDFLIHMVPRSLAKKIPAKEVDFEEAILTGVINLKKTMAIGKRAVKTAQIFINTEKRGGIVKRSEEKKTINEIKSKLVKYFEEKNIEVIIKTKEELYGKTALNAPDITLYMKERGYDALSLFYSGKKIWDNTREKATHNTEGIILTDMNLNLKKVRIVDMMPTILDYFGISSKSDGKSVKN